MDKNASSDISESVTISAAIAAVATGLIYVEFWGGSIPALGGTVIALGVGVGVAAGAAFYYTGTRSTPVDDIPPLAVFFALAATVYVLFPQGLPTAAELAIVVGVWTDTALRAWAKYA
ncbi:MAG: hypothetical protein ACOCUA_00340 [archaeon]